VTDVRQLPFKAVFLAAVVISMGGWLWLLVSGIRWLILKI
jgi:hypothetical protein